MANKRNRHPAAKHNIGTLVKIKPRHLYQDNVVDSVGVVIGSRHIKTLWDSSEESYVLWSDQQSSRVTWITSSHLWKVK